MILIFLMFRNQRTTDSGSLEKSEWKNCQSQLFQKPKSSCGFHEELENNHLFMAGYFIFQKNWEPWIYSYISKPVWLSWRSMVMNPKNHPDNHWGSVPVSSNYLPNASLNSWNYCTYMQPTDVWHKINHKRFSRKKRYFCIDICWIYWKLNSLGLLLQIHKYIRCSLAYLFLKC